MNLPGLNWVDLSILLIAVFGLIVGYVQGLLRQVIWLAALYVATVLGAQYYALVAGWIRDLTFQPHSSRIMNTIAFLIIVITISFVLSWLAADVYPSGKIKIFSLVNQIGGSILALVTLIVMLTLALAILDFSIGEPWPGNETLRSNIVSGLESSGFVLNLRAIKKPLLDTIIPWLPGGLPSIFNL